MKEIEFRAWHKKNMKTLKILLLSLVAIRKDI